MSRKKIQRYKKKEISEIFQCFVTRNGPLRGAGRTETDQKENEERRTISHSHRVSNSISLHPCCFRQADRFSIPLIHSITSFSLSSADAISIVLLLSLIFQHLQQTGPQRLFRGSPPVVRPRRNYVCCRLHSLLKRLRNDPSRWRQRIKTMIGP